MRSTPTTCRTCGARLSPTWAAPHAMLEHERIGLERSDPRRRTRREHRERRVVAVELADLTAERVADPVFVGGVFVASYGSDLRPSIARESSGDDPGRRISRLAGHGASIPNSGLAVSAGSDKNLAMAATTPRIPMRVGSLVPAGTYHYEGDDVVTGWHHHDLHQVEYALEGIAEVETEARPLPAATRAGDLDPGRTRAQHHAAARAIGRRVLRPSDDHRLRRPRACAGRVAAVAGDDDVRDSLADRPARERRRSRRVLRGAARRHRRSTRPRSAAVAADERRPAGARGDGAHPRPSRRRARFGVCARSAARRGRCDGDFTTAPVGPGRTIGAPRA